MNYTFRILIVIYFNLMWVKKVKQPYNKII